ncbi:homoprotocatechuate degradation operon regulator HpaR [Pelagibacterium halotolerans]|uniref:homoprotocatechuate degradation operon regulator HpaR n=1 Tax=Pelagibacterium halotolerans TaxID=531813 RepID=UPI0038509FED
MKSASEKSEPAARRHVRLREFSRSLPMSLLKAREAVMGHFRPSLHYFGITEQQWRVLRALTSIETIEVMELAKATFLLPPSLSRILKDLEERDLITRRTSPEDMRRGLISISERGRTLIDQAGSHSEAIYAEITRRFGAEKLTQLQQMLRELETALADPIEIASIPKEAFQVDSPPPDK